MSMRALHMTRLAKEFESPFMLHSHLKGNLFQSGSYFYFWQIIQVKDLFTGTEEQILSKLALH